MWWRIPLVAILAFGLITFPSLTMIVVIAGAFWIAYKFPPEAEEKEVFGDDDGPPHVER